MPRIDPCGGRSDTPKAGIYRPGDSATGCRTESNTGKEGMTGGSLAYIDAMTMGSVRLKLPSIWVNSSTASLHFDDWSN